MHIKVERLDDVAGELDSILHEYWVKTDAGKGMPKLAMDWAAFSRLDHMSNLLLMLAREGQRVLGFVMYVITQHLKHKTLRVAHCDTLAVRVGERGKGIGSKLMKVAEGELRRRNVDQVVHGYRLVYDAAPLFPKLGYKAVETLYMKEL